MSGLFLGGLASGMDTESVITKIMSLETMRVRAQESKKAQVVAKQNAWKSVESSLSTLKNKLDAIRATSMFSSRKATLSDDKVASVSVTSGATAVTHDLQVSKLAQTHVVGSANFKSPNQGLGVSGALTIGTQAIQVDVTDTLYSLRDKINANTNAGVKADVVTVMQGAQTYYRMVLTAKQSGMAGEINLSGPAGLISSNPAIADASGVTSAGPYQIEVTRSAQASFQTRNSSALQVGSDFTGTFRINNVDVTVGTNTAQGFLDAVNAAGAGVTAVMAADGTIQLTGDGGSTFTVNGDDGTLEALGLVVPATYTVNGTAYKSLSNTVTGAAGVAGLNLNLSTTGEARVGGYLEVLGFRTSTGLNNIAKAQDAEFKLNGMDYQTSTNTVTGVLPGMTLTLKTAGTTTVTVSQDEEKVTTSVKEWVDSLNATMQLLKDQMKWNDATKSGAPLNGDSTAQRLYNSLRGMLSYSIPGAAGDVDQLSDVGVQSGAYGTADYGRIVFDETKLKAKLAVDPDAVAKVFGAMRDNVARTATVTVTSGDATKAGVTNGDTDTSRIGTPGGGWIGNGVPSGGTPESLTLTFASSKTIDQIALTIPDSDGTTGLQDFTISYRDMSGTWKTIETVTGHRGTSRLVEFQPVSATAVKLEVTATYGGTASRVTELGVMAQNVGVASNMYNYVKGSLASETGTISVRQSTFDKQIKALNQQIERMNEKMVQQEDALRKQFTRMEQIMARLQAQSGAFASQIAGLSSK